MRTTGGTRTSRLPVSAAAPIFAAMIFAAIPAHISYSQTKPDTAACWMRSNRGFGW